MFSFRDASRYLETPIVFDYAGPGPRDISIDTRSLNEGDFFIALKTDGADGHRYLEDAFNKGASGALVSQAFWAKQEAQIAVRQDLYRNILVVEDTQQALEKLARCHRKFFSNVKVIGITGSVGKTTTRNMLHYLLSHRMKGTASRGNFNNHLGVPLTLLRIAQDDEYCVVEMGANHVGEIKKLCEIAQPTEAIITSISAAHIGEFGSLEQVYNAKLELVEALPEDATVILPDDDELLWQRAGKRALNRFKTGYLDASEYKITNVTSLNSGIQFHLNGHIFWFPGFAEFWASNAAMAVAMTHQLGVSWDDVKREWQHLPVIKGRFEMIRSANGILLIHDAYNASPNSFRESLRAFHAMAVAGRRVVAFGDMLELGEYAQKYHRELAQQIENFQFDDVLGLGQHAKAVIDYLKSNNRFTGVAEHFENTDTLAQYLIHQLKPEDAVLFKGSRSMRLENVIEKLHSVCV